MSDEKVDHLAEAMALRTLAAVPGQPHGYLLAAAQVHATLYLAEQQRLANLIAFMDGYDKTVRDAFIRFHDDAFGEVTKGIGIT